MISREHGRKVLKRNRSENRREAQNCPPIRPYDATARNDGFNNKAKAVEYALWLAQRDDVHLPPEPDVYIEFVRVTVGDFKTPIARAAAVTFNKTTISIPHTEFDPSVGRDPSPPTFEDLLG